MIEEQSQREIAPIWGGGGEGRWTAAVGVTLFLCAVVAGLLDGCVLLNFAFVY